MVWPRLRWSGDVVPIAVHPPPSRLSKTVYLVSGGPFGVTGVPVIVSREEPAAGPVPALLTRGAGTAGGMPADCIRTAEPNGP